MQTDIDPVPVCSRRHAHRGSGIAAMTPHPAKPLASPAVPLPSAFDSPAIPGTAAAAHDAFASAVAKHALANIAMPGPPSRRSSGRSSVSASAVSRPASRRAGSFGEPLPPRLAMTVLADPVDASPRPSRLSTPRGSFSRRTHDQVEHPHASKWQMADYLRRFEHIFAVSPQRCRILVDAFIETLELGLKEEGHAVPMIPAWVFGWPTGKESGPFLAVDLGGTNLRVCRVELAGDGKFEVIQAKYKLTEEQKQVEGQLLFDFCAECLSLFLHDQFADSTGRLNLEQDIALGFTFSYPCIQSRIDHGELLRWTKGFGNPNVEGKDVAVMFMQSLKKYNVPIKLTALINDTTGTLIASHYVDSSTRVGVIFGTGCNAAYMEKVSNIPKIAHLGLPDDMLMAINCEWGAFDSETHEHLPRTKYDVAIDESSNKPGQQPFEKMIAGLYLGEVFRLIMIELNEEGVLFVGQNTYKIEKPYSFDTAFLSLIESDVTDELLTVTGLFIHFFQLDTTISERQFFRRIAQLIGTRAARLSACGVAALVSKQGLLSEGKEIGIATDGSLYNKYPKFADRMHDALVDIFGDKGKLIKSFHAEDGSGVGAAVIAAMTKERRHAGICMEF